MPIVADIFHRLRLYAEENLYFTLWRQKLIQIVLWLLAETNLECSYYHFFRIILLPSLIGSELFWQFFSARITDTSPKHAKTILLVTSISQIVLDVAAIFFSKHSKWFVFVWFILRFAAQQQVGNSSGKILKMRIEWVLQVPQDKQLSYFNSVVVIGELLGRLSAVVFVYVIGVALGKHGFSFYTIRNVFFVVLGFWDIACLVCTLSLPVSYFLPEDRKHHQINTEENSDSLPLMDNIDSLGNDSDIIHSLVDQNELNEAYEDERQLGEPSPDQSALQALYLYFADSAKKFWQNGILVFSCVHLWTAFMLVSFVNIVLKFEVSDVGTGNGNNPTRGNLCNGQLVNILQIGISENLATLGGVFIYHFGMTRVKPMLFYNKILVLMSAIFCLVFFSMFWKESIGATGGSVMLGLLYVGLYLVQTYDGNVSATWSHPTIIAFVFAMQASIAQVMALVPIIFAALKFNDRIVLVFCILTTAIMGVGSFFYSRKRKRDIVLASDPQSMDDSFMGEDESPNGLPLHSFLSPEDMDD